MHKAIKLTGNNSNNKMGRNHLYSRISGPDGKTDRESLMAEWLGRQHLRDIKCSVHDLEVMGLNPG